MILTTLSLKKEEAMFHSKKSSPLRGVGRITFETTSKFICSYKALLPILWRNHYMDLLSLRALRFRFLNEVSTGSFISRSGCTFCADNF